MFDFMTDEDVNYTMIIRESNSGPVSSKVVLTSELERLAYNRGIIYPDICDLCKTFEKFPLFLGHEK